MRGFAGPTHIFSSYIDMRTHMYMYIYIYIYIYISATVLLTVGGLGGPGCRIDVCILLSVGSNMLWICLVILLFCLFCYKTK